MNIRMNDEILIRTYIRNVLNEDYEGLGDGGDFGLEFGSPKKLYQTFLEPFADVFSTAAGKTKELSIKLQTLGKTAFEAIGTTFLPTMKSNYDKIRADEKIAMDKIKSQYADVYKRAWDAIKDHDILAAAWMYDPTSMVTSTVIKHAPTQVFNLINVLAGGALDKLKNKAKKNNDKSSFDMNVFNKIFSGLGGDKKHEGLIREGVELNDKIAELINSNPRAMQMMADGKKVFRSSLERMFDDANAVKKARSIDDLQKALGKQVPALQKVASLQEPERSQVEQKLLQACRSSTVAFYVDMLKKQAKAAIEAGVPKDHPYITDIKDAIARISS